jgi:hypothetical protein
MTVGEVVASTPSAEVSTPSAACREQPALVSVTGGEVVPPSAVNTKIWYRKESDLWA